ncbi:MAG: hypothetical protein M3Z25_01100 [Actinomycetota bacterium]|nr:hypothetical protein [Actinomycetota bacterium]
MIASVQSVSFLQPLSGLSAVLVSRTAVWLELISIWKALKRWGVVRVIVGVHGIAQQQLGPKQLARAWVPALEDGVQIASGRKVLAIPFKLAFYGNVFLNTLTTSHKGSADVWSGLGAEDDTSGEGAELVAAAREMLTEEEWAAAASQESKGYIRTPAAVQVMLRALDAKFGPSAGVLYLGALRQVRRYLVDDALKAEVDRLVAAAVPAECRVLVGHSLGSVVALEYVRQHPEHELDLLLTVGSPLGLRMVTSRLPVPFFGADSPGGVPATVGMWVNVRDPHDPVACAGDLHPSWPGVQDRHVENEGDAHSVARYLSKTETGEAILAVSPPIDWTEPTS